MNKSGQGKKIYIYQSFKTQRNQTPNRTAYLVFECVHQHLLYNSTIATDTFPIEIVFIDRQGPENP